MGGEMKEAWGKRTEENHLRRFRDNFPEFPAGHLIAGERPDFLVKYPDGDIGIEHTRYIRSDLGAQEHAENKALWLASREYENKGYPPVEVRLMWNFHEKPDNRSMPQIVEALCEFVAMQLPEPGGEVAIRYPHEAWRLLPQEIVSLTISRSKSMDENYWVSTREDLSLS